MSRFDNSKVAAAAPVAWRRAVPLRRAGPHAALALQTPLLRALTWLAGLVLLASALTLLTPPAWAQPAAERRVALVIGNADYPRAPLVNPVNDAADLSAALRRLGFEVIERRNRNADELKRDLIEFQDRLGPGAVGLFYFAGHGMQAGRGGRNYLLPVGVDYRRERDVELFGLDAGSVLARMEESGAALSLVILDACRDSPLPPEGRTTASRGLGRMEAPSGSLVAFATAPGRTADENRAGRNGLYTQYLLRAIETPGLRLEDVFQQVRRDVERASNRRQSPEEISKLTSAFFFRPAVGVAAAPAVVPALPGPPAAQGGGVSLADLEREQQARQAWADWQQRMQADFDRIVGFQGAADLRVQAWQRFLEAWKTDNPTSTNDERLREQAIQSLRHATQGSQAIAEIRHADPQGLSVSSVPQSSSVLTAAPVIVAGFSSQLSTPVLQDDRVGSSSPGINPRPADSGNVSSAISVVTAPPSVTVSPAELPSSVISRMDASPQSELSVEGDLISNRNPEMLLIAMLDSVIRQVEDSPLGDFKKWNGAPPESRDKIDMLAKLRAMPSRKIRYFAYGLFTIFSDGVIYSACKQGKGVNLDCVDFDRQLNIRPDYQRAMILANYLSQVHRLSSTLGKLYENGWGVRVDLPRAWVLYKSDKGEYGWTDANRLVQRILVSLGEKLKIDGDFGPSSCLALRKHIKNANCSSISEDTVRALVGMLPKN